METTTQLRDYRVKHGQMEAFIDAWRTGVVPLRRARGFTVEGAWCDPDENRFVWVVSYDGPEGFEAASDAYYASPEREAMDPSPAVFIAQAETTMLRPVEF